MGVKKWVRWDRMVREWNWAKVKGNSLSCLVMVIVVAVQVMVIGGRLVVWEQEVSLGYVS